MNTLKLLDNYWQLYKKNITLFFIFITVLHTIFFYYQLSVPFENPKFFMNIVMIFFNYFATFLVFFSTYKNLTFKFKTNTLLDFLFIMEIVNFTAYYILHNNDKWNTLIYMLYPTKLTKAILEDAIAVPWALEVIGFNLIIYGFIFILLFDL